jgi:hypothetical protein
VFSLVYHSCTQRRPVHSGIDNFRIISFIIILIFNNNNNIIIIIISIIIIIIIVVVVALQPVVGPWPFFQFLDPIHGR